MQITRFLSAVFGAAVLLSAGFSTSFWAEAETAHRASSSASNFAQNAKLIPNDPVIGATFGHSVAVSGDTAVIGSWQDTIGRNRKQGSVYVFVKKNGVWINQAKLIAADGKRNDLFGFRVAIDGDTIIVGVPEADIGQTRNQGAVYVFTRRADNWEKQVKLVASDGGPSHLFGQSVAVSGDTILIGAPGVDNYLNDKTPQAHGAAYIFTRNNGNWTEKQKIAGDGKTSGGFGMNVALDNKTAVVGNVTDENYSNTIYIFSDDGTGWKKEEKIGFDRHQRDEKIATDGTARNLAIDGGTIVVGAEHKSAKSDRAVFVYVRSGGKWTRQAVLKPSDGSKGDSFGWSADISGDRVVVGSHLLGNQNTGTVYVYERSTTPSGPVWQESQALKAADGKMFDQFGVGVGIDRETILVGADNHDLKKNNGNEGAAYIFSPSSSAASASASAPLRDGRNGSGSPAVPLGKDARKNGYKITVEGSAVYLEAKNVEDPRTKKLLEALKLLEYRCQQDESPTRSSLTFSAGNSARVAVACAILIEPKILLMEEPGD
ncbi:MAG: hypothetical protein R2747_23315 [Pyrinomonadaceae bacterium]